MPWNEPGSNNQDDRDNGQDKNSPWGKNSGNKNGNNQPPDLDEVIKNITDKINNMFGSKSSGGGNKNSNNGSPRKPMNNPLSTLPVSIILIVLVVVWIASGFYTVREGTEAVVLRLGKYQSTQTAGLHWRPRFVDTLETVDVSTYNSVEVGYRSRGTTKNKEETEALMLTEDENIVDIEIAIQYNIKDPTQLLFNVVRGEEDNIVRQSTESALREIVGRNTMDFAITEGRGPIASETKMLLQEILDRYETGINILEVELQNAQPPIQVKAAFDDAVKAREDRERFKNQAEAYANRVVPVARGEAARITEEASAYKESITSRAEGDAQRFLSILTEYSKAPEVTRERLYIESMENVLSNSSKLYIDQSSGNGQGSVFYLPLDQILNSRNQTTQGNNSSNPPAAGSGSSIIYENSPSQDPDTQLKQDNQLRPITRSSSR